MRIEIVCRKEAFCDLLKARVEQALADLQLTAEVDCVRSHTAQEPLGSDAGAGLVIDGQLIALGTGHSIDDISRMIRLRTAPGH